MTLQQDPTYRLALLRQQKLLDEAKRRQTLAQAARATNEARPVRTRMDLLVFDRLVAAVRQRLASTARRGRALRRAGRPIALLAGLALLAPTLLVPILAAPDSVAASPGRCDEGEIEPGADLAYCDLTETDLAGADLSGADLSHANLTGVETVRYVPVDTRFVNEPCPAGYTSATGWDVCVLGPGAEVVCSPSRGPAHLGGRLAGGAGPTGSSSTCAYVVGIRLIRANLTEATLVDADLRGADLHGANLIHADLSRAKLGGVRWGETTCPDGSLSDVADGDDSTCLLNLDLAAPVI